MSKLSEFAELEDIYFIVDLFASEYGWTIEYIENLTIPEITSLLHSILKRKGVKDGALPAATPKENSVKDLVRLARQLGASKEKIQALQEGKPIKL